MGGEGRASVHDTTCDSLVEQNRSSGAHNSLRVPRQDPPLLPSIIFPLGQAAEALRVAHFKILLKNILLGSLYVGMLLIGNKINEIRAIPAR